jgi:hypothetical protein
MGIRNIPGLEKKNTEHAYLFPNISHVPTDTERFNIAWFMLLHVTKTLNNFFERKTKKIPP